MHRSVVSLKTLLIVAVSIFSLSGLAQNSIPDLVSTLTTGDREQAATLGPQLVSKPAANLALQRPLLLKLASTANSDLSRQYGWAALITSGESPEKIATAAFVNSTLLSDLYDSIRLASPNKREFLFPLAKKLLEEVPVSVRKEKALYGKTIRITSTDLTFPTAKLKVEIWQGGQPLSFTSRQLMLSAKGTEQARMGLELDFGTPRGINELKISCTGAETTKSPFLIQVFDSLMREVRSESIPAERINSYTMTGSGSPINKVKRAILRSLPHYPGHESEAFSRLVFHTMKEDFIDEAFNILLQIPEQHWNEKHFMWLAEATINLSMKAPKSARFSQEYADRILLAEKISTKLTEESQSALKRILPRFPIPYRFRIDPTKLAQGKALFGTHCASCHSKSEKTPTLDGSDWIKGDPGRVTSLILNGLQSVVRGTNTKKTSQACPKLGSQLTATQAAALVTYVRNDWNNNAPEVDTEFVEGLKSLSASGYLNSRATILAHYPLNAPEGVAHLPGRPGQPHIVFVTGDEEYRSEETMPLLARLLNKRFGFTTSVCFSLDATGTIDPNHQVSISGLQLLEGADLMVLNTRFRELPDEQFQHFLNYVESGRPVVGFRTATHAFKYPENHHLTPWGWHGEKLAELLGQNWITHHGHFGDGHEFLTEVRPSTTQLQNPILTGVTSFKAYSWLYHVQGNGYNLRGTPTILLTGKALKSKAAEKGFPIENPVAWTKNYKSHNGNARVFFHTTAHPYDFKSPSVLRLSLNGILWALGRESMIPPATEKIPVPADYNPNNSGMGSKFKKGLRPEETTLFPERFTQ